MSFAFSIFDDTDNSTVANLTPVYRLLDELGLRTTKSVWPLRGPGNPGVAISGETLEDGCYRDFVVELKRRGFEIALHGVRNGSAVRERTIEGLEVYERALGHPPMLHTNHSPNRDNMYWGSDRFTNGLVAFLTGLRRPGSGNFGGHLEQSEYFWGDLCRERIKYLRNLVFDDTNLNAVNPSMPYRNPSTQHVNYWFSSTDGADVQRFCAAISEKKQDQLEREDGVCIVYTHFSSGFVVDSKVHPRFEALMRRLTRKEGNFQTVGRLLDQLLDQRVGKSAQVSCTAWSCDGCARSYSRAAPDRA
ncbi:MAG: hypothetical protein M3R04_02295 [bacterium]|nr:hypothetical protein [bacterium]